MALAASPKFPTTCPSVQQTSSSLAREKEATGFYLSGHPLDAYKREVQSFCTATTATWQDFKHQDVWLAAIVATKQQKRTKTDKPFIVVTLEDLAGSMELTLFGQDVATHGGWFEVGNILMMRCGVRPRFNSSDQFELKPLVIHNIQDVRDKLVRGVRVHVDAPTLSALDTSALLALVNAHPGTATLQLAVREPERGFNLDLHARQFRISPDNAFLDGLELLGLGNHAFVRA